MNIAIDISPLKSGHFLQHRVRGTGFYLKNLKKSLEKYYPENKYVFFSRGEKIVDDVEVVHYPYFEPFFLTLPFISKSKFVVTVHDLTPLVFPKNFPAGIKGKIKWRLQKLALKKASAVIADSKSSKRDIVRFAGISKDKVNVVYLAAGEEFRQIENKNEQERVIKKFSLPNKFVLYVGDVTWNKNLPRLIEAAKKSEVPLVLAGGAMTQENIDIENPWNQDLIKVRQLAEKIKSIFILGFVDGKDLTALYNAATVFAMPSLYEGFGLPILEAMSCGCPVITSGEGSTREIAGKAAYYVDAYSVDNIALGIKKVFSNSIVRTQLIEEGLKQAKRFSWEKTALDTLETYRRVIAVDKV